jgi:hypothetical protein
MNWCVEQFGVPGNRWSSESTMYDTIFKFNNQEDANFFFLKWGQ